MRRILLSALFALSLHVLLLTVKPDRFQLNNVNIFKSEPISLTFSYKQPDKEPVPVMRIPPRTREKPKPVKKAPMKKVVAKKKLKEKRVIPIHKKQPAQEPVIPSVTETHPSSEPAPSEPVEVLKEGPPAEEVLEASPGIEHEEGETRGSETQITGPAPPPPLTEASPVYKENPLPRYPKTARRRGYEGTVILDVLVNRDGRVEELRLGLSSGYPVLDRAAMSSVKDWLFEPAKKGGQKIEMWVKVPVRFELK